MLGWHRPHSSSIAHGRWGLTAKCHQFGGSGAPGTGVLTAGPQQLIQGRQRVQTYLENEVGEEEEEAGPQQSFEEAAGVTCKRWAPIAPSSPRGCQHPHSELLGRVHWCHTSAARPPRPSAPSRRTLSAPPLGKPRHGVMWDPRTTLSSPFTRSQHSAMGSAHHCLPTPSHPRSPPPAAVPPALHSPGCRGHISGTSLGTEPRTRSGSEVSG